MTARGLLEVRGITKSFGGLVAVDDLSFSTVSGGITGLIGPNGAGKTTTFGLICGVLRKDSGSVCLDGADITHCSMHGIIDRGLAHTFQAAVVYPNLSVEMNIETAILPRISGTALSRISRRNSKKISRREVKDVVEHVLALTGLRPHATTEAGGLPYGLQKTLGIASALATGASLLLLDEPAAGLNETESDALGQMLRRLVGEESISVCLVEHHMRLVMRVCEKIVVMVNGRKLTEGIPSAIAADPEVIDAYLGRAAHEVA